MASAKDSLQTLVVVSCSCDGLPPLFLQPPKNSGHILPTTPLKGKLSLKLRCAHPVTFVSLKSVFIFIVNCFIRMEITDSQLIYDVKRQYIFTVMDYLPEKNTIAN